MSILENDVLFNGLFSNAGIISASQYNIFDEFKKVQDKTKHRIFQDSFLPDKEWEENLTKEEKLNPNDLLKGCKFNIDELKSEIKKYNIYYKDDAHKLVKNEKKKLKKNLSAPNKNMKLKKNKYEYHDLHMQKIEKYKKEGIYQNMKNQQVADYSPNLDYIHKKLVSGPQWNKLSGRDMLLHKDDKKMNLININLYKGKSRNARESAKPVNKILLNTNKNTKIRKNMINSAKSINTNQYRSHNKIKYDKKKNTSYSNNLNDNEKTSSFFNQNKYHKGINSSSPNLLILKNPNRTTMIKKRYRYVPDFDKYIDFEKLNKKVRRNNQVQRLRDILNPNYSAVKEKIKTLAIYYKKSKIINGKNKIIEFEGINTNDLLYDACHTYDLICGNKCKSAPKFQKMSARPNDINLPTYMKGLNSRIGLELSTEKTLKMNNYENGKIYSFKGFFNQNDKKYNSFKRIYFEDEINDNKNKIQKDLALIKRRFKNIRSSSFIYD